MLTAESSEIGSVVYGSDAPGNNNAFVVYPPDKETFLEFPIAPRGSLRGKVETSTGIPLKNVAVEFRRPYFKDNRIVVEKAGVVYTNVFGEYDFGLLPPTGYILCAAANALDRVVPPIGFLDLQAPPKYSLYAESCLPPRRITSDSASTANFKLSPSPSLMLSGRLAGVAPFDPSAPNAPFSYALLKSLSSNVDSFHGGLNSRTMEFEFEGLEPGKYSLSISYRGKERELNRVEVIDVRSNVAGLAIEMNTPMASLRFAVTSVGSKDLTPALESLQLLSATTGDLSSIAVNGGFPQIGEGNYWLSDREKGNVCITSATLDGEPVLKKRFHLKGGKDHTMSIRLSEDCGSLTGQVQLEEKTVLNTRIVALLSGSPQEPGDLLTFFTGSDGKFTITGMAPGSYQFAAWREDGRAGSYIPFSFVDADFIIATVAPSESRTIEIPLSKGKP